MYKEFLLILDSGKEINISFEITEKIILPIKMEVLLINTVGKPSLGVKLPIVAEGENIIQKEVLDLYTKIKTQIKGV